MAFNDVLSALLGSSPNDFLSTGRNSGYGGSYGDTGPLYLPPSPPQDLNFPPLQPPPSQPDPNAGFTPPAFGAPPFAGGASFGAPFGASFGAAPQRGNGATLPGLAGFGGHALHLGDTSSGDDSMPFTIPVGGVYGQQKWLPGSTGADIFLPRNSPIVAKTGGQVLEAQGGTGLNQGAEMIIRWDDGTTTRFRHVQPMVQGGQIRPGQTVAVVSDQSMDMLSRQVASGIGAPDGFQHLDLSIDRPGDVMFSPQGGSGGDTSAPQWLQSHGYGGRVVPKTPGPQEGMSGGGGGLGMGSPFGGSPFGGGMPGGGMSGMPGGGMFGMPGGGGMPGMPGMPPMMGGMPGMGGMGLPPMMGMPSMGAFPPMGMGMPFPFGMI